MPTIKISKPSAFRAGRRKFWMKKPVSFERLMLGLRLREGIEWHEQNPEWLALRSTLCKVKGLLEEQRPGFWRVPEARVALTNQILLPFLSYSENY